MRLDEFLSQNTQIRSFEKGEAIFTEGHEADAAYYIAAGQVQIFKENGGKPSVMATLGPGQIFGEMALLRFDKYTLSARAETAVKLYVIPPELLQQQILATPPLVKAILDMLTERIHGANEVLIDLDRINRV